MKNSTKNIILGVSSLTALAATFGAVSYMMSNTLLNYALDRKIPTNMKITKSRLSGIKGFEAAYSQLSELSETFKKEIFEDVEIVSRDGIRLVGHWSECENAKRIIIAMHGWRSDWAHDFAAVSDFWHKNGCSVLYAEQRGQNNSGGDYMGFGLLERFDCLDWIDWVNERTMGFLPVYLGGISMGATTVLMAAGLDLPDNVCGIVADCGFTSPCDIWKHVVEKNLHLPYDFPKLMIEGNCRKKLNMGSGDYSAVDAMKVCKVPVLFIHGSADSFVPIEMTYENYLACAAPKRLLVVPGAEHAMSYYFDKDGYENSILSFWKEFDKK